MNYYVINSNQEIELFDTSKSKLQTTLKFKPELADKEIQDTEREIVVLDNKFVFADEHIDALLAEAKEKKLDELSKVTVLFEDNLNQDMYFTSSLGFRVNGDRRTRSNIEDLIRFSPAFPVQYKDYDNIFQKVTEDNLETMLQEHITNGLNLYQQKFSYESQINECQNIEEVNAIEIEFEMMDFSNQVLTDEDLLKKAKSAKLGELAQVTALFENNLNKDMYFTSSLGFRVNGDRRARSNIEDLIAFSHTFPVAYRDYDNTVRHVTKDDLRTMLAEHVTNGTNIYQTKGQLESQIQACTTVEAVNAIEIKFEMMDFSK